jgi:hypothetical protein
MVKYDTPKFLCTPNFLTHPFNSPTAEDGCIGVYAYAWLDAWHWRDVRTVAVVNKLGVASSLGGVRMAVSW